MKPYYEDDAVTIYHGDCMDVLPTLSGVGMVLTSPPYNLGQPPRDGVGTAVERWMVVGWAEAPEAATRLVRWAAGRA